MMKDRTKIMFAEQLEKMLETMPLEKVRVSRLCKLCGATPPTFYYYFHDKYDLVAWMYMQDFSGVVGDREPGYSTEILNAVTRRMEKRKAFYQKAFTDQSQNSIVKYMLDFNLRLSREAVRYVTGEALTSEQVFAVKYHVYGIIGMFREWLFGNEMTVEELNRGLYERTPRFLKEAFDAYPYSTEELLQQTGKQTGKARGRGISG